MSQLGNPMPKSPTSHLHAINLVVALFAGVISITGGIYTLKSNLFSGPTYGSLQGIVRDERIAKPLKLVAVEVSDLTGAVVNTATTSDDGDYLIESLKTGNYVVKFTAPLHKTETKTIKIEKDLTSTISVDLVPEVQTANVIPLESTTPALQNIQTSYVPASSYSTAVPVTSGYNTSGNTSSVTGNSSTYGQSDVRSESISDSSFLDSQLSGFHQRPRRPPPGGGYGDASSTNSQGDAMAQVGTQLLQALMSKKSDSN